MSVLSYTAYALGIRSSIPLPELVAAEAGADVTVRLGRVGRGAAERAGACLRVTGGAAYLYREEVGAFRVRGGCEVVVDPAPSVDKGLLRLFLLGPVLGLLLQQRGRLTLHASTARMAGGAAAFLGDSGWGKSTLVTALYSRGHAVVADDVTAVEIDVGGPSVSPGYPQVKLWPEAAAALGYTADALPRLHSRAGKRAVRVTRGFPASALPLRRVYVLTEGETEEIVPLRPREALVELVRHSYTARVLPAIGAARHLQQCASLVNHVPVRRLRIRRSFQMLRDSVRMVEEDLVDVA